ncbi:MAG: hypothetical protein QXU09_03895, partial [Thermoproteota archaeon]
QPEAGLPPGTSGQTLRHDGTNWVANSLLFNNGTNIGIGTTSPAYKLDVAGTSRIQGDIYINSWPISITSAPGANYVLKWNGTAFVPQPEAGLPPGTSGQTLRHDGTNWVANSLLFNNGTNIGIGTTSPAYKLDVAGNSRIQGDIYINSWPISVTSAPTVGYVLKWNGTAFVPQADATGIDGSGTATQVAFWTSSNTIGGNNNLWWDNTNNRLGIGTSSPAYRLDVVGASRIQGDVYINSWPISITSAPGANYVLKWNGSAFVPQPEAGLPPGTSGQTLRHDGTNWVANSLLFNNGTNIGIGTTSPAYKLDVAGTSRIQGDIYINSWPISVTSAPTVGYVLKWNGTAFVPQADATGGIGGSGTATQVAFWTSSNTIGGNNNLWWDNTNNRLGIGTSSPAYRLDVADASRIQGDLYINSWPISITSAPGANYVLKWNGSAFVPQPEAGLPPGTSGQTLRHDGTNWVANSLLFNNGTNIGIGTTSPAYRLDVAGTSRIQGDIYINSWPISVTSAPTVGYVLKWNGTAFVPQADATGGIGGSGTATQVAFWTSSNTIGGNNNLWWDNTNNRLGIGTSSPAYRLDVVGTSRIQGDLYINSWPISVTSAPTVGYVLKWNGTAFVPQADATGGIGGSGTATQVAFWTSSNTIGGNSNLWWDNTNNRLGIGTSSPSYMLHVTGSQATGAGTGLIHAVNTATSNDAAGVYGQCSSTDWYGYGGYFRGGWYGVYGTVSPTGSNSYYGVAGYVSGGSGYNYGVYGYASSSYYQYGVLGDVSSSVTNGAGVLGHHSHSSGTGTAGLGNALTTFYILTAGSGGAFTGTQFGDVGFATNTTGLRSGGYFATTDNSAYAYVALNNNGTVYKINGAGSVASIMETRAGKKNLFAPESPEAWIEDYGEGQLVNGRAKISLDPLFLDCVVIDENNPLKVFVQLRDDCNGVYVKTYKDGFEVIELQNGKSNARFCYKVVAKWKGYEKLRFPDAPYPQPVKAQNVLTFAPVKEKK